MTLRFFHTACLAALLLLFFIPALCAADSATDSLLQRERTLSPADKMGLYRKLFAAYKDSNLDSALFYEKKAEALAEQLQNKKELAGIYLDMGILSKDQGHFYTALNYYYKYLHLSEENKDKKSIAKAYNNIGVVYKLQKSYNLALSYMYQSLDLKKELGEEKEMASTINNIGALYFEKGEYDSSLMYYNTALALNRKFENRKFEFINLRNIAESHLRKKEYDSCTKYLAQAQQTFQYFLADKKQTCEWLLVQSHSQFFTGHFHTADSLVKKALALGVEGHFQNEKLEIYELLTRIQDSLGNKAEALKYLYQHNALHDSIYQENISIQIADLQKNYLLETLANDVEKLHLQKYLLISIIIFSVLVVLIVIFYLRKRYLTIQLLDKKNRQLQQLDEEKNNLIRLVAHDLKSPLARIHLLAELVRLEPMEAEEKDEFLAMIKETSRETLDMITKYLMMDKRETFDIQIKPEEINIATLVNTKINRFKRLAAVKNIRINSISITASETFYSDLACVRQILANLLSNAIKFTPPEKCIELNVSEDANHIIFEIKDEGPGIPEEEKPKLFSKFGLLTNKPTGKESSSGLGLFIVKNLVDKLGGSIDVKSTLETGSSFFVKLPKTYTSTR